MMISAKMPRGMAKGARNSAEAPISGTATAMSTHKAGYLAAAFFRANHAETLPSDDIAAHSSGVNGGAFACP